MAKKARAEAARLERKKQRRRERGNVIGRSLRCLLSGCAADTRGWDDEAEEEAAEDGAPSASVAPGSPSQSAAARARRRDLHSKTWGKSLDLAFSTQGGSEGDFLNRVAALMQDPAIVSAFAQFDAKREGVVPNEQLEQILYQMGSQVSLPPHLTERD